MSQPTTPVYHIRRCHVCGSVTESEGSAVHKCASCGKHLAPFYYFDESKLEGLLESGPYLSTWKTTTLSPGAFNPIWGLSTYWQENYEGQSFRYS
jgi:ribosomal protein S14